MVALFLCLNYIHKYQHQDFASIIESMQDYKYLLIRVDGIEKRIIKIILFVMIEVMFLIGMQIRLNVQFI